MILNFSTITNCENMAYRSFRIAKVAARGVRKVTTGITGLWQPSVRTTCLQIASYKLPTTYKPLTSYKSQPALNILQQQYRIVVYTTPLLINYNLQTYFTQLPPGFKLVANWGLKLQHIRV